jgi:hypothetical protein
MSYLLSERHFRRHESHLRRITAAYPTQVIFESTAIQPDVLARNIRYAAKSLLQFQWPTDINLAKFFQIWDDVMVSPSVSPNAVVAAPEPIIRQMALSAHTDPKVIEGGPEQLVPKIHLTDPNLDLIKAVVVFHHFRYLTEPSVIVTNLDLSSFGESYDIALSVTTENSRNTYTIL